MSRLVHDFPAIVRACQMSSSDFFCYVEGVEVDSYLYDRISSPLFARNSLKYEFSKSNSLTPHGKSGGKQPLLNFFSYLRLNKLLSSDFKGKKTSFVFFLDKDIDDIEGCKLRSKHLMYTEYYDIQNYLFLYGDFVHAAAIASSLPLHIVTTSIGSPSTWLENCALQWKNWIVFCTLLKVNKISLAGYGRLSAVNNPTYGVPCPIEFDKFKTLVINRSGLTIAQVDILLNQVALIVDSYYIRSKHDKLFKGKWYFNWLVEHLVSIHGVSVTPKELTASLTATLDFDKGWIKPFQSRLQSLINIH